MNVTNECVTHAPFTGFGDDYHSSIKFTIEHPGQSFPQWSGGRRLNQFVIAGSDRVVTQRGGRELQRLTLRLWFDCMDDLEAMDDLQGYRSTLRYLWGLTKRAGGTEEVIVSTRYLNLPDTMLISLSDEVIDIGGICEATATFERAYVARPVIERPPFPDPAPDPVPDGFGFGEWFFGEEEFGEGYPAEGES